MRTPRGSLSCHDGGRSPSVPIAARPRAVCSPALTLALAFFIGVVPLGSTAQRKSSSPKIDRALDDLLTNGPAPSAVRVIIRARDGGARESLKSRLQAHGDRIQADHGSINAFTATVHSADLAALADDPATEGISIDAVVRPHQSSSNSLLGTELLPDPGGATGGGVRIAILDSGLELTNDLSAGLAERKTGKYICYGIVPRRRGEAVGVFELRQLQPGFFRGELGFVMDLRSSRSIALRHA